MSSRRTADCNSEDKPNAPGRFDSLMMKLLIALMIYVLVALPASAADSQANSQVQKDPQDLKEIIDQVQDKFDLLSGIVRKPRPTPRPLIKGSAAIRGCNRITIQGLFADKRFDLNPSCRNFEAVKDWISKRTWDLGNEYALSHGNEVCTICLELFLSAVELPYALKVQDARPVPPGYYVKVDQAPSLYLPLCPDYLGIKNRGEWEALLTELQSTLITSPPGPGTGLKKTLLMDNGSECSKKIENKAP